MINTKNLYQYTQLAQAAYANFWKLDNTLTSLDDDVKTALIDSEMGNKAIVDNGNYQLKDPSHAQANQVIDNWSVLAHWQDLIEESSFSGTLFQGKTGTENAGGYVLALKGTLETAQDLWEEDIKNIVLDGLALNQIMDLYNFWQQICAGKDQNY